MALLIAVNDREFLNHNLLAQILHKSDFAGNKLQYRRTLQYNFGIKNNKVNKFEK